MEIIESDSNSTALKLRIDVDSMKPAEQNTQDRTASSKKPGGPHNGKQLESSTESVSSGHTEPLSSWAVQAPQTPDHIPTPGELLRVIAAKYMEAAPLESKQDFGDFLEYLKEMQLIVTDVGTGSLLITVKCNSLQILNRLWEDYLSDHLGEMAQRCFVTEELLKELSLAELKLKTTILEEEYEACKSYFEKDPASG